MTNNQAIQNIAQALEFSAKGYSDGAASILLDVRNKTKSRHVRTLVYRAIEALKLENDFKRNIQERKEAAEYCAKNFAATEQ